MKGQLRWGTRILCTLFGITAAPQSSPMMPSFFPKEVMFCTTFSCIRLKHMAITAMPSRMYTVQKMNWNGTRKKTRCFGFGIP